MQSATDERAAEVADPRTWGRSLVERAYYQGDDRGVPYKATSWPESGDYAVAWYTKPQTFGWWDDFSDVGHADIQPFRIDGMLNHPETAAYTGSTLVRPGVMTGSWGEVVDGFTGAFLSSAAPQADREAQWAKVPLRQSHVIYSTTDTALTIASDLLDVCDSKYESSIKECSRRSQTKAQFRLCEQGVMEKYGDCLAAARRGEKKAVEVSIEEDWVKWWLFFAAVVAFGVFAPELIPFMIPAFAR